MRVTPVAITESKLTQQASELRDKVLGKNSDFIQKRAIREDGKLISERTILIQASFMPGKGEACRGEVRKQERLQSKVFVLGQLTPVDINLVLS